MAVTTVKSTYSLDLETVRALEDLARQWNVSKSEVIRRAVHNAKQTPHAPRPDAAKRLAAFDALQKSMNLDKATARRWMKQVRDERNAWAKRMRRVGK